MADKKILLGKNIKYFLVGDQNLACRSNYVTTTNTAEEKVSSTFCSAAVERDPSLLDSGLEFGGFTQEADLFERVAGPKHAFNIGLALGAAGDPVLLGSSLGFNHELTATEGELEGFKFGMKSDDLMVLGKMLQNAWDTAVVATGSGSIIDVGSAVAADKRLHAVLLVRDITGAGGTINVIVESDELVGFATPVTRITFAQESQAAPNKYGQIIRVSGPITPDTRYRVSWTFGGGATAARFAVGVGIR